jgi:hypothetical protein
MAFREPESMTMRQLLGALAQQYCAAASWFLAAGQLDEAVKLLEQAAKALSERDHFVGLRHEA